MKSKTRQQQLLAILVVLMMYLGWNHLRPRFVASTRQTSGRRSSIADIESRVGQALPDEYPTLLIAALDRQPGSYSPGRDPFRYAPDGKSESKPVASEKGTPPTPKARRPGPKQAAPEAAGKSGLPKIDLTYLGSFGLKRQPIAVFVHGGDIINAVSGDVLSDLFIVHSIGYESVELKFVGFPNEPAHRLASGG